VRREREPINQAWKLLPGRARHPTASEGATPMNDILDVLVVVVIVLFVIAAVLIIVTPDSQPR
jgi:hypothetical protein